VRIREMHPYETPEIVALPVAEGDPAYLKWIEESVAG
jgi:periplasmic divalent cation tolerance protein